MIIGACCMPHPPIVVPEVGGNEVKKIQKTYDSMTQIGNWMKEIHPDTIVLISPHMEFDYHNFRIASNGFGVGSLDRFNAPEVTMKVSYDTKLIGNIIEQCSIMNIPIVEDSSNELDHASIVPLYFMQDLLDDVKIVRVSLSCLDLETHDLFGHAIARACKKSNERIVILASGDTSHCSKEGCYYGYNEEGKRYDEMIVKTLKDGMLKELKHYPIALLEQAMECGHRSYTILGGILDGMDVKPTFYSYENTFGVGYVVVRYDLVKGKEIDPYVQLAKRTIETYVTHKEVLPLPNDLPEEMLEQQAGCFVSIKEFNQLRGCIGTFVPTSDCIALEIISNAISSCSKDPRFYPVTVNELEDLKISVDILKPLEPIDDFKQLDVKKYGLLVEKGYRKGILLPNLEGIDDVQTQYRIACSKAGIDVDESDVRMYRFEVIRHG